VCNKFSVQCLLADINQHARLYHFYHSLAVVALVLAAPCKCVPICAVSMDAKKSSGGSSKKKKKSSKSSKKKSGKTEKASDHDEDKNNDDDDDVDDDNATDGYDICSAENCVKPTGELLLVMFVELRFCRSQNYLSETRLY